MPGAFDPTRALEVALQVKRMRDDQRKMAYLERSTQMEPLLNANQGGHELYLDVMANPGDFGLSPDGVENLTGWRPGSDPTIGTDYRGFERFLAGLDRRENWGQPEVDEPETAGPTDHRQLIEALMRLGPNAGTDQQNEIVATINNLAGMMYGNDFAFLPEEFQFPEDDKKTVYPEDPNNVFSDPEDRLAAEGNRLQNILGSTTQPGTLAYTTSEINKSKRDPGMNRSPYIPSVSNIDVTSPQQIQALLEYTLAQADTARGLRNRATSGDRSLLTDELYGWTPAPYDYSKDPNRLSARLLNNAHDQVAGGDVSRIQDWANLDPDMLAEKTGDRPEQKVSPQFSTPKSGSAPSIRVPGFRWGK